MRKTVALPFIGIALASVIAAGCSGTGAYNPNANSTPTPLPSPTIACTTSMFPAGEQVQMVFPQHGGTAVANLQGVVFAVSPNPLPTNWFVYAQTPQADRRNSRTRSAFLAVPTPSASATPTPLPTPSDTPSHRASARTRSSRPHRSVRSPTALEVHDLPRDGGVLARHCLQHVHDQRKRSALAEPQPDFHVSPIRSAR